MKKNIHPKYFSEAEIICACGNVLTTGSVKEGMKVEVCSACHPFYTGKKRLVDSTGRVDRFKKRMEKSEKMAADKVKRTEKKKKPAAKTEKPAAKTAKPVTKKSAQGRSASGGKIAKKKAIKAAK
jgi:large subunit ribosomal protein L31